MLAIIIWNLRRRMSESQDSDSLGAEPTTNAQQTKIHSQHTATSTGGSNGHGLWSTARASHPVRINRIPDAQRGEGFEAEKYRAFGESQVFGIVTGEANAPLGGVTVQLYENDPMTSDPPLREAYTDAQGSYTLERVNTADRRYILAARSEGYAPEVRYLWLTDRPAQADVHMVRGVELSGTARDARTSEPLSNVTVVHPAGADTVFGLLGSVQTGLTGRFTFPCVRPGSLKTLAQRDGYHQAARLLKAPDQQAEIAMEPGGATIRGVTVSRMLQKPAPGAKVIAEGPDFTESVISRDDGAFEFLDMPGGKYRLYAIRGMPSEKQDLVIEDTEVRDGLSIIVPSDLFVSGRVLHANDDHPLPGVRVYYRGPSGKNSVLTDEGGQFGFETIALNDYFLEVHEKNFLPVLGKGTTGSVERITRTIANDAASDHVIIKLKPVPAVWGDVRRQAKGKVGGPVWGVDVAVAYAQGDIFETRIAQTDTKGGFFVNLPDKIKGYAKVLAQQRGQVDAVSLRIPNGRAVHLVLKPSNMRGELLLSDKSQLSGVRVIVNYLFPDSRPPERALRLKAAEIYTDLRGRFSVPLAAHQRTEIVFFLPDGKQINKIYNSDSLLQKRNTFTYDPVEADIVSDVNPPKPKPSPTPQPAATPNPTPK